jgi:hypothetical protein
MLPTTLYSPPTPEQLAAAKSIGKKYVAKYNGGSINHWQLTADKPDKPPCAGCHPRGTQI